MRKLVYIVFMLCVSMMTFTGCKNEKPVQNVDSIDTDSSLVVDTTDSDTMAEIITETPMPKAADQLFDDFFFNFIASPKVQKARIKWPLPVYTYVDKQEHITSLKTFITQTALLAIMIKSTKLDTVVVEKIRLREGAVEQYWFDHQDGKWKMNKIRNISFEDSKNASFLNFLQKFFSADGAGMIKDPLPYHGADPNGEETNIISTTIPASDWSTYLPAVPGDVIYNIIYGQKYGEGNFKILDFKGLSNGLETQLIFKRHKGNWKLVKINAY